MAGLVYFQILSLSHDLRDVSTNSYWICVSGTFDLGDVSTNSFPCYVPKVATTTNQQPVLEGALSKKVDMETRIIEWTDLKIEITNRNLLLQGEDENGSYYIRAKDDFILFKCEIFVLL